MSDHFRLGFSGSRRQFSVHSLPSLRPLAFKMTALRPTPLTLSTHYVMPQSIFLFCSFCPPPTHCPRLSLIMGCVQQCASPPRRPVLGYLQWPGCRPGLHVLLLRSTAPLLHAVRLGTSLLSSESLTCFGVSPQLKARHSLGSTGWWLGQTDTRVHQI